jgi:lysophospholipase L1-like esterase
MTMRVLRVLAALCVSLSLVTTTPGVEAVSYRHYMAFGDSITIGYSGPAGHYTHGYPARADVRGAGMGGYTAHAMATWWPDHVRGLPARSRPRTAVFHIGVNDLVMGAAAETVIASLRRLRRIGRSLDVRVVFGTIVPAPLSATTWRAMEGQRRLVNRWIREQSTFVEYARPLTCGPGMYLCPEYEHPYWHDVHPNDHGQALMGYVLRTWIEDDRD